jgi:hypothetical protein
MLNVSAAPANRLKPILIAMAISAPGSAGGSVTQDGGYRQSWRLLSASA